MLHLPTDILRAIENHAAQCFPEECCGILLGTLTGDTAHITHAFPSDNTADPAQRTTRYLIDPRALLHADRFARDHACEILGAYHSHPNHPPVPSATDSQHSWEGYLYLILPITKQGPQSPRAWRFRANPAGNPPPYRLMTN